MDILLIQPSYKSRLSFLDKLKLKLIFNPYITLQQIATITPGKHTVSLLDETFQKIDFNEKYDLVGVTCCTPSAPRAYQIADKFRSRGMKVVLGGYHPSALPKEAKQHADSIVIGESENSWPLLLSDLEKNRLCAFYHSKKPVDLNSIPNLKRNIGEPKSIQARIEASRGCPYRCEFCSISNSRIGWHVFRKKSIDKIVGELKAIPQKFITFSDSSLTIDVNYTKALFKEMKHLNKKFICYGNVDVLNKDEELLRLAKAAGCQMFNVGFESVSQEALNSIGKNTNKIEEYSSAVEKIKDHNIAVIGQFILGFDTDTKDIFDLTIKAIRDIGVTVPSINILTPYPGTPFFERLNREGRILTKDWTKYTLCDVVFQPKQMLPEELSDGFHKVVRKFHSISNMITRDLKSIKLGFYPLSNVISENIYERGCYTKIFRKK